MAQDPIGGFLGGFQQARQFGAEQEQAAFTRQIQEQQLQLQQQAAQAQETARQQATDNRNFNRLVSTFGLIPKTDVASRQKILNQISDESDGQIPRVTIEQGESLISVLKPSLDEFAKGIIDKNEIVERVNLLGLERPEQAAALGRVATGLEERGTAEELVQAQAIAGLPEDVAPDAEQARGGLLARSPEGRKIAAAEATAQRVAQTGKKLSATEVKSLLEDFTAESVDAFQGSKKAIDLELKPIQTEKPLSTEQQIQFEGQQQGRFTKASGNFIGLQDSFSKIAVSAQAKTAAGDMSLIFAFMKMLDPTSVVREGEQASAASAAGIPERIWRLYNKAVDGQRLGQNQRKDFVDRSRDLFSTELQRHRRRVGEYGRVATSSGLRPENVTLELIDPSFRIPSDIPEDSTIVFGKKTKDGKRVFKTPAGKFVASEEE